MVKFKEINNKKGTISRKEVQVFLFAIVAIIVFIVLIVKILNVAPNNNDICRQSVVTMSAMAKNPGSKSLINEIKLRCPLETINITTDDKKVAMRQIAEAMRNTWYVFGEGKLNLFYTTQSKTFCMFHDLIVFKGKAKKLRITNKDFLNFLNTNKMKYSNEVYSKYLFGRTLTQEEINRIDNHLSNELMFNTDDTYVTMYNYTKIDKSTWGAISKTFTIVGGVALAIVIGSVTFGAGAPLSLIMIGVTLSGAGITIHDIHDASESNWHATLSVINLNKNNAKKEFSYCYPSQNYNTIR